MEKVQVVMVSPESSVSALCLLWGDIGSCLVSTLNYSFEHGELTSSQKQAVMITLIEKRAQTRDWLRTGDQSHSSMLTQR